MIFFVVILSVLMLQKNSGGRLILSKSFQDGVSGSFRRVSE